LINIITTYPDTQLNNYRVKTQHPSIRVLIVVLVLMPVIQILFLNTVSSAQKTPLIDQQLNFGKGLNGKVLATTYHNNVLYVGGEFTSADGATLNYIARWDKDRWRPLLSGLSGPVYTLYSFGNKLFVGGNFSTAAGKTVNYIATWDGSKWEALGSGFNGPVRAINLHNNQIHVGGDFTNSGQNPRLRIAKWSGTAWDQVSPIGPDGSVNTILTTGGNLIIGGSFNLIGTQQIKNIALFSGANWSSVGGGIDNPIRSLALFEGSVIAATESNPLLSAVRRWNGSSWVALGQKVNGSVYSMTSSDNELIIAGNFFTINEIDTTINLSKYSTNAWKPLGNPNSTVLASTIFNKVAFFGGAFDRHENNLRPYFSRHALSTPDRPIILGPSNNATRVSIRPLLRWESKAAFGYQIQLSEDETFTNIEIDTLVSDLNTLQVELNKGQTRYYMRVRASNNINSSEWSENISFTTLLRYPTQREPFNGQRAVSNSVVFRWEGIQEVLLYHIQVSTSDDPESNAGNLIVDQSGIPPQQTQFSGSGFLDDATYYWRIRAEYKVGDFTILTDWSDFSEFTVNLIPPVPIPLAPGSQVLQDSSNVSFRWGNVTTADNYQFQLSLTSDFTKTVLDTISVSDTITITALNTSEEYFWRVRSTNIAGFSNWSPVLSFKTKSSRPSKVNLISPSNTQKDVVLTPTLVWSKTRASSKYKIELSNSGTFPSGSTLIYTVNVDTVFQVPKLSQGLVYNWRVTAINEEGVEGESSSAFSFTTINSATPSVAPVLISPTNTKDSLGTSIQFSWQAVSGALSYRIQLSKDLGFNTIVYDNKAVNTNEIVINNLLTSQEYFWRVSASNSAGEGPWSPKWFFTTIFVQPGIPVQNTPINGFTNVTLPPLLRWDPVQGAESYEIQFSLQNNFESDFSQFTVDTNLFVLNSATNSSTYYWRVRAINKVGESSWSPIWTFTTIVNLPNQITLTSPQNDSRNVALTTVLNWSEVAEIQFYRLQVSESNNFTSKVITDVQANTTSFSQSRLRGGTKYYWRVAAVNIAGQGDWSTTRSFTTIPPVPEPPTLIFPANSNQFIVKPDSLVWQSLGIVDSYQIQLSKNQDLELEQDYLINLSNLPTSKLDFRDTSPLESNTVYYWRVRAKNISGTSEWSPTWPFRTNPGRPSQVKLIDPVDKKIIDDIQSLIFKWAPADSALFYQLDIADSDKFIVYLLPRITQDTLSFKIPTQTSLPPNETFYWRVRAGNNFSAGNQFGDWSEIRSFVTKPNPPDSVRLKSPINGYLNARRNQILRWEKQTQVTRYFVEVATSDDFVNLVKKDSLSAEVDSLKIFLQAFNQSYYWRVRAENQGGKGKWSKVNQITTFNYPSTINTVYTQPFPNTNQSSYRLVSIPGKVNVPIHITFEDAGKQGVDWNAYSFDSTGLLEAKSGNERFNFKPGNGFWILSKKAWSINRQPPDITVDINSDDVYPIELKTGWNIISNPFDKDVSWQSIKSANGLNSNETLWYWSTLGWTPENTLVKNRAYYFRNTENIPSLKIPYPTSETNKSSEVEFFEENNPVSRSLAQLDLVYGDQIIGSSKLFISDKTDVKDYSRREPMPPNHFPANRIYWVDQVEGIKDKDWYIITQQWNKETIKQRFSIGVLESAAYRLQIRLPEIEGLVAQIWDNKNQRWLQLTEQGVDIYLLEGEHPFELYLGSEPQIAKLAQEMLPTQFELQNNYPNPFNPTTTLRFALPQPNKVQLTIYDVMGRKVSTLISKQMEAGYHNIDWNASHLASGVYIVELIAGSQRRTQKIALIK